MKKLLILTLVCLFGLYGCADVVENRYDVIAINNMTEISGDGSGFFFVWSVDIDSELYYWMWYKKPNGETKLIKIHYEKVTFFEEDGSPYLILNGFENRDVCEDTDKIEVHIPTGSIKRKLNVDSVSK